MEGEKVEQNAEENFRTSERERELNEREAMRNSIIYAVRQIRNIGQRDMDSTQGKRDMYIYTFFHENKT
jgi:hypothetical protein